MSNGVGGDWVIPDARGILGKIFSNYNVTFDTEGNMPLNTKVTSQGFAFISVLESLASGCTEIV